MKIEPVAAYVRVSTQEQKLHGLSLDAQKMKLEEYATSHNMKIVGWYLDEGVSGRKLIRKRPELQRMIQDAEQHKFERIIFIKLDRFFRSVAEYHECMKRIAPVVWTTTEEEYDLTTANGRMLVNMKLTIAEMEADMTGERINIVNDYKLSTGQPISGSQPFGFMIGMDTATGKKNVIHDPEKEPILLDLIDFYMLHQSKRKSITYLKEKYCINMGYESFKNLMSNPILYGSYRNNPVYCEPYISKDTFDRLQIIGRKNIKENTAENRCYIFSGLIICPECGRKLQGSIHHTKSGNQKHHYKVYRCANNKKDVKCSFGKIVLENTMQKKMLANIEQYFENVKMKAISISDSEQKQFPRYNVDEINAEIDRLNYSWQTGKIRTVEKYEKDYALLIEKLKKAEEQKRELPVKDFEKINSILQSGWRGIYESLDDEHRRAFWRSFVKSIEINWTTENKEITKVDFF